MEREEMILDLENQMVKEGSNRKEARSVLDAYSNAELAKFYAKRIAKSQPVPQTPTATWEDVRVAREELQRDRERHEVEAGLEFEKHVMEREQAFARQKKAEADAALPQDKETFRQATRQFKIGANQANFAVIRETLCPGFTLDQLRDAIQSRAIQLAPATQSELDQWEQDAVEERNAELLRIAENDPAKLRKIVREEAAQARAATAQAEAEERFQAEQERDGQRGYPKLPDVWQGQALDANFLRRCSVETHKLLARRFGNAQLNARLNGRG